MRLIKKSECFGRTIEEEIMPIKAKDIDTVDKIRELLITVSSFRFGKEGRDFAICNKEDRFFPLFSRSRITGETIEFTL